MLNAPFCWPYPTMCKKTKKIDRSKIIFQTTGVLQHVTDASILVARFMSII